MHLPNLLQTRKDLDHVLMTAVKAGMSDIHLGGEDYIKARHHGEIKAFSPRVISSNEAENMLVSAYDENMSALSMITTGEDLDFAYVCKEWVDDQLLRFRVNASSRYRYGKLSIIIVFRVITSEPPSIHQFSTEKDIVETMTEMTKGLAIVVGPTGSGKSTLLASIIRHRLESRSEVVITHESPIEYVYDDIETMSVVNQREIGRAGNYKTFYEALVGALRQDPDLILVGEARDKETINAAIHGVQTGHALFTTMHTTGVAHTINRMVKEFEDSEREAKLMDIIDSLSMIVYQNLVLSTNGKRIALREYLVFDGEIKDRLRECPVKALFTEIYAALIEKGQTLLMDAEKKLKAKQIDKVTYTKIKKQFEADISKTKGQPKRKSNAHTQQ
jgi:Dot/Icm secretion system ATPase DotB